MFGFFKSAPYVDPQLGELQRSRGAWRGSLRLDTEGPVSLVLGGGRSAPDADAVRIAQSIASDYASWRPVIEQELYEHYLPYAEAEGEQDLASSDLPSIDEPSSVWPHTTLAFVQVIPPGGDFTVEIGYRVSWDEEHTLVPLHRGFDCFRAHTAQQCKAALRRHSLLRQTTATRQWCAVWAPFGRAGKRPSAALRSLELARPVLRSRALQLSASRRAEPVKTSVQRYSCARFRDGQLLELAGSVLEP